MRSIDALPFEIWLQVSALLTKQDILKFRLVAPRSLLPTLNASLFETIIIDIDATDDLPRWGEAEPYEIALRRVQDITTSRIVEHVRVLTLRLTRPYSLSAYYEKNLGVKNAPTRYNSGTQKPSTLKRISSIFLRKPLEHKKSLPDIRKNVDYSAELALVLQKLFKATDLVNTIRIIEPAGYNSEYDVVYPSIYARLLVRLLTAVQSVDIPANTALELLDIPITHLEEAGLDLKSSVGSTALQKFTSLALGIRFMGYDIIPAGAGKYTRMAWRPDRSLSKNGLGTQVLKAISANHSHYKTFKLTQATQSSITDQILGFTDWTSLRHLSIEGFKVSDDVFGPFMVACLPQLESLVLRNGTLNHKGQYPIGWKDCFEAWILLKEELPAEQWSLKSLVVTTLYSTHAYSPALNLEEVKNYVQKLVPPQPKKRGQKATI